MDEQKPTVSTHADSPAPVPDLQLLDREQLRVSLKPAMSKATFANWLYRQQREYGFPEPIRTGSRACSWSFLEVRTWLAARPRKGVFTGRRRPMAVAG